MYKDYLYLHKNSVFIKKIMIINTSTQARESFLDTPKLKYKIYKTHTKLERENSTMKRIKRIKRKNLRGSKFVFYLDKRHVKASSIPDAADERNHECSVRCQ